MTRVKIPVSTMGTPLTEEELKSIVGGRMDKPNTCYCTLSLKDGTSKTSIIAADSEEKCKLKCQSWCDDDTECDKMLEVKYVATYP